MPWEKNFEIDSAIDKATDVFRAKGYEAASLSNLIDAIGITKGSFYNAFGSKKALFTEVLKKYDREQRSGILADLSELNDPVLAINTLFDRLIHESLTDKDKKGCLLINTALDLPNQDEDIGERVQKGLSATEAFLKQQVELGIEQGVMPKGLDVNVTAKGLFALIVGLRVLARGVYDQPCLEAIKRQAISLIQ